MFAPCATLTSLQLATPIATKTLPALPALPQSFFCHPAEEVAPGLIGCLLVKCLPIGELLWGVVVETEAYSQEEPTSAMRSCNLHPCESPGRHYLGSFLYKLVGSKGNLAYTKVLRLISVESFS